MHCKPSMQRYHHKSLLRTLLWCAGTRSSSTSRARDPSSRRSCSPTWLTWRAFLSPALHQACLPVPSGSCRLTVCRPQSRDLLSRCTAFWARCWQAEGLPAAACSLQWVLAGKPKACLHFFESLACRWSTGQSTREQWACRRRNTRLPRLWCRRRRGPPHPGGTCW